MSGTNARGKDVFTVAGTVDLRSDGTAQRTHSPGLRLPPGHALSRPLGVRGQVVNQLAADLVGGLEGVSLLQCTHKGRMIDSVYKASSYSTRLNIYKVEIIYECWISLYLSLQTTDVLIFTW